MSGVAVCVKEVSRIPIWRSLYSRDKRKHLSHITKLYYY